MQQLLTQTANAAAQTSALVGTPVSAARGARGVRVWQRSYYERVIRGDREFKAIREYITQNPLNLQAVGEQLFFRLAEALSRRRYDAE